MRTFLILICSFVLVCSAGAAQNDNKSKKQAQKRTQAQPTQYRAKTSGPKTATPKHYQTTARTAAPKHYQPASRTTSYQKTKGRQQVNSQAYQSNANLKRANSSQQIAAQRAQALNASQKTKRSQQITAQRAQALNASQKTKRPQQTVAAGGNAGAANYSKKTKQWKSNTAANARFQSNTKTYKARHFNLASNTRSTKFTGRVRIIGPSEIIDRCGTTGSGGGITTTVSFSYTVVGITGMRAGGTRRGVTLPMHTTPMMVRSTVITACRPIK